MIKVFGYTFTKDKEIEKKQVSFVPPDNDDGALYVGEGGGVQQWQTTFDPKIINDFDLVMKYRKLALVPEAESAIDDIIDEAVVADDRITLNLDNIEGISERTKETINENFDKILSLLDWDNKASDIFRRWYIEGRIYYHKIIDDKNTKKGIVELRPIDATNIKKVKEIRRGYKDGVEVIVEGKEYYNYNRFGQLANNANTGIKIAADSIAYVHSGLLNENRTVVLSHLHKALKIFNQLQMLEDAAIVYRVTRAPERRAFYIDVGNLPAQKAEQYVNNLMSRFRNKLTYDSATGEIRDAANIMSIIEDFWLPRREGNRGTEITTLPAGQQLGEITDIEYFQKKFYKALKIPLTRLNPEGGFNLGRASEITRDEIKFNKFIKRLRKKFSGLFDDLLYTQLVLTGVIAKQDWKIIKEKIEYIWPEDSYFSEFKYLEMTRERLALLRDMQDYSGRFFSDTYFRKEVLRQSDEEIERIDKEIEEDKKKTASAQPKEDTMEDSPFDPDNSKET